MNGIILFDCRISCISRCFLEAIFKQKAEYHVQEISGKHGQRRFGGGETETDEFGVKELERKENASARFECFEQPGESRLGQSFVYRVPGNKSGDKMTLSSTTSKLMRGDPNQIERTRLEFHNMQISQKRHQFST